MNENEIREELKKKAKGLSRRDFMKYSGLGAAGLAISPALLAACSSDSGSDSNAKSVTISNWTTYISEDLKKSFTKDTGIKLDYKEDINDNNEYFAKIQPQLNRDKSINRDGFILTDWMADRIINTVEWAQPLDDGAFTNRGNMVEALRSPKYDPERKSSAPWASIITGIAYNIEKTGKEIKTFEEFLAVDGNKTVLSEMRDTIGVMMMAAGVDITTASLSQINTQFDALQDLLDSGKIGGVNGNEYITDLASGTLSACLAWSGDAAQITQDNPNIRFVVPESGGTLSSDVFMIPVSSEKADLGTEFINYFYDPAISAKWVTEVQFISPVEGVAEELEKLGGESAALASNPLVVPDDEILDRLQIFGSLSSDDEEKFDKRTAEIVGA